jgi:hypothetical protein
MRFAKGGRRNYILSMSVQEIQAAPAQMSPKELGEVEQCLTQLKESAKGDDDYAYGMKEYDMTREELEAFEKRQDKENREQQEKGLTVAFEGPFDPAWLD